MSLRRQCFGLVMGAAFALAPSVEATTLIQMNLKDLATRADRVFRGTVIAIDSGAVRAGGSDLPTTTYRLKVEETFKGEYSVMKNDVAFVELRMVGAKAEADTRDGRRHFSAFRDVPRLEMHHDYVLFTTQPSAVGLSTTVGLGQGAFRIVDAGKEEQAVNAFGNAGLARGLTTLRLPSQGPVPYGELAAAIRAVLSQE